MCRAICDWGNSPNNEGRVAALSKLFPYLELVSAKELDFDEACVVLANSARGYDDEVGRDVNATKRGVKRISRKELFARMKTSFQGMKGWCPSTLMSVIP